MARCLLLGNHRRVRDSEELSGLERVLAAIARLQVRAERFESSQSEPRPSQPQAPSLVAERSGQASAVVPA